MKRVFLANGDSFTAGDELADFSRKPFRRSAYTWAPVLSRFIQCDRFINAAASGNSPQAIARTTLEAVSAALKACCCRELLVGVMWGPVSRMEVADEAGEWQQLLPGKADHGLHKLWFRHFHNDFYCTFSFLQSILTVQHFLKHLQISYFMLTVESAVQECVKLRAYPAAAYLFDLVDWDVFYFLPQADCRYCGFYHWALQNGHSTYPQGHLRERSHEELVQVCLGPWVRSKFLFREVYE